MRSITLRRFLVFLGLVFLALFWLNSAGAQAAGQGVCCQDRWDPAKSERLHWGRSRMGRGHHHRMQRHWTFMHQGIPDGYRGVRNSVQSTAASIDSGRGIYQASCAQCHGASGMGDGDAGKSLSPAPALLAYMVQRPVSVDGYLLWSISEGGSRFGSGMPAFKDELSRDDIWKVILYMRAGFPADE